MAADQIEEGDAQMEKQFAGGWTPKKLQALPPEQLFNVWVNAYRVGTPDALALAQHIEASGLNYGEKGGISLNDPRAIEMAKIIESEAGRAACVEFADRGEPALAGVEPMIVAQMGDRYGSFSQMTITAGSLVGALMYRLGYEKMPNKRMPPNVSVAQTAATWRKKVK